MGRGLDFVEKQTFQRYWTCPRQNIPARPQRLNHAERESNGVLQPVRSHFVRTCSAQLRTFSAPKPAVPKKVRSCGMCTAYFDLLGCAFCRICFSPFWLFWPLSSTKTGNKKTQTNALVTREDAHNALVTREDAWC